MIGCYRLSNGSWQRFDVLPKTESIIWQKRFFEVGSMQIKIQSTTLELYDIVVQEGKSGIVMHIKRDYESCNVYGYDLKGIASFRAMSEETVTAGQNVETTLRGFVTKYLLEGERAIEGLVLEEAKGITKTFSEDLIIPENTKLSDVLEEQCRKYDIGWEITFDKGILTFSFTEPRENSEIIFSRKYRTLESAEYIWDAYDEVNNSGSGILRREGEEETDASNYITGVATPKAVGYILGDKVTVEEFGMSAVQQITEIEYVYEPNNIIVVPSFGEVKKNIIKKLMKG